jgi:hypothetical protein
MINMGTGNQMNLFSTVASKIYQTTEEKLSEGTTRVYRAPPASSELLVKGIQDTIRRGWSDSTWSGYGSVWRRFQYYKSRLPPGLPPEIEIMMFIESCRHTCQDAETGKEIPPVSARTAYQYSKRLTSILFQTEGVTCTKTMKMYRSGLLRTAAEEPVHQATPLTREEFYKILENLRWDEQVQLTIMWKSAARHSDFRAVRMEHLTFHTRDQDHWQWGLRTLMHKGDPFGEGTGIVLTLNGHQHQMFTRWKETRGQRKPLLDLTYPRLLQILRTQGDFTEHSIKRGALVTMLLAGVDKETLRVLAKHRDLAQLLHYLPIELAIDEFYHTAAATKFL